MPNREKFVAKCAEHDDITIRGPVAYQEHRERMHSGLDFTLVWERRKSEDGGMAIDGVMRLLRRAWRRAGGQ